MSTCAILPILSSLSLGIGKAPGYAPSHRRAGEAGQDSRESSIAARTAPGARGRASEAATAPAWSGAKPRGQRKPPGVSNLRDMVSIARRPDSQRQPALYGQILTYLYQSDRGNQTAH